MADTVELDRYLTRQDLQWVLSGAVIRLSTSAVRRMEASCASFGQAVTGGGRIYGVDTGLGDLVQIDGDAVLGPERHRDLIRSHACGVGEPLNEDVVRMGMALRAANLARGHSAVRPLVVRALCELLNRRVAPIVPSIGSVGASGDPILLAHVAAVLIGDGVARVAGGPPVPTATALSDVGLKPVHLQGREGLALVNGLDFSLAMCIDATAGARRALRWANAIAALSLEAFAGSKDPFLDQVQAVRGTGPHRQVAESIRQLIHGSDLIDGGSAAGLPQDPYSLRCIPQVHGSVTAAVDRVEYALDQELLATVDNPVTIGMRGSVHHCGHFHGQELALSCDYLAIALVALANIAHARSALLLRGQRGLPLMLAGKRGSSGLMMLETLSASLIGRARAMATPLSIQSISASSIQEDHVSMAWEAARRTRHLGEIVFDVLAVEAVEAIAAARARDRRRLGQGSGRVLTALAKPSAGSPSLPGRVGAVAEFIRGSEPPLP
jgi:histidine ammonia-lyase